ncbi:hypothetical protein D3C86_486670 [compost metagenome]
MEDVAEPFDVEAPRRDVGGHEQRHVPAPEAREHLVAVYLRHVAIERADLEITLLFEPLRKVLGLMLHLGEKDGARGLLGPQQGHQAGETLLSRDAQVPVAELGRGLPLVHERHAGGIRHLLADEARDLRGNGRRQDQRLLAATRLMQEEIHVLAKAHVEHAIRLVEHQEADAAQVEAVALGEVLEPSRRADDEILAALNGLALLTQAHAAIEGHDAQPACGSHLGDRLADLNGQLPRRNDHECLRPRTGLEAREQGQAIGQCLSGPRLGLDDDVALRQDERNGLLLNGGQFRESHGGKALEDGGAQRGAVELGSQRGSFRSSDGGSLNVRGNEVFFVPSRFDE